MTYLKTPILEVYLDTNIISMFNSRNKFYSNFKSVKKIDDMSKFKISHDLEKTIKFLDSINKILEFKLYIPEIVRLEMINHYIVTYEKIIIEIEEMKDNIVNLKRLFNDYITSYNLDLQFKNKNYEEIIEESINEELKKHKIEEARFPRQSLERLVGKAINYEVPFRSSNSGSDIGFKDAVLLETVLENSPFSEDKTIVLFTGDGDFDDVLNLDESKHIKIIKNFKEFEEYISSIFDPDRINTVKNRVEINYFITRLLESEEIVFSEYKLIETKIDINYKEYLITQKIDIDDTRYIITYNYDLGGNEAHGIELEEKNEVIKIEDI